MTGVGNSLSSVTEIAVEFVLIKSFTSAENILLVCPSSRCKHSNTDINI
jgi:hypothetical protein